MTPRRRNLYIGTVAIGLLALLIDRALLREPSPASADVGGAVLPAVLPGDVPPVAGQSHGEVAAAPFPRRFGDPLVGDDSRDVFALTPEVREALDMPETGLDGRAVNQEPAAPPPPPFSERHALSAVLVSSEGAVAVVDGQPLRPGQTLDGCRLAEVTGRSVRFECPDGVVELFLPAPALPTGAGGNP